MDSTKDTISLAYTSSVPKKQEKAFVVKQAHHREKSMKSMRRKLGCKKNKELCQVRPTW